MAETISKAPPVAAPPASSPSPGIQPDSALWSDSVTLPPGTPAPAPAPAVVHGRFDPKHRLHRNEASRVIAEGGSIIHNGEIHTSLDTLPEEYVHGDAYTLDSPHHPKNRKAREDAARLRAIQEGRTVAEPDDSESAEVEAEKQASKKERGR